MTQPAAQDNPTMLLARAFSRSWKRYYLPDRDGTVSEEVARHSLARHLVAMVKEGVNDEEALATGGLLHLVSLEPEGPQRGMLNEPISKSKERTLAPETFSMLPACVSRRGQPRTLLEAASRVAAAIGVSAIVAFVFIVLVVPRSQKSDAREIPAFEKKHTSELAGSELLALQPGEAAKIPPEESQALLERFIQWQEAIMPDR